MRSTRRPGRSCAHAAAICCTEETLAASELLKAESSPSVQPSRAPEVRCTRRQIETRPAGGDETHPSSHDAVPVGSVESARARRDRLDLGLQTRHWWTIADRGPRRFVCHHRL